MGDALIAGPRGRINGYHDGGTHFLTTTKAVFTIGQACQDIDTLAQMLDEGATCARCDLTWGTLDNHASALSNLQAATHKTQKLCAIMVEISGRETLVGGKPCIVNQPVPTYTKRLLAQPKEKVILSTKAAEGGGGADWWVRVSQLSFPTTCSRGDIIVLSEYLKAGKEGSTLHLTVIETSETSVTCVARNEAQLEGLLSVFPVGRTETNPLSEQPVLNDTDMAALTYLSREFEIDFLCLSFTEQAGDIQTARQFLDSIGLAKTQILAKLETGRALFDFRHIAERADGIVLSRGNLNLDVRPEKFAPIQKAIISKCNLGGKPVLVTRTLDSMTARPHPLKQEVEQAGVAVTDGCDALLLGAETALGAYPVEAVNEALAISSNAELSYDYASHFSRTQEAVQSLEDEEGWIALASQAIGLSRASQAKLIVLVQEPGMPAGLLTKFRPQIPVLTVLVPTLKQEGDAGWTLEGRSSARQCLIHRGLLPVLAKPASSGKEVLWTALKMSIHQMKLLSSSDYAVVVQKGPSGMECRVIVAGNIEQTVTIGPVTPARSLEGVAPRYTSAPKKQSPFQNGMAHANGIDEFHSPLGGSPRASAELEMPNGEPLSRDLSQDAYLANGQSAMVRGSSSRGARLQESQAALSQSRGQSRELKGQEALSRGASREGALSPRLGVLSRGPSREGRLIDEKAALPEEAFGQQRVSQLNVNQGQLSRDGSRSRSVMQARDALMLENEEQPSLSREQSSDLDGQEGLLRTLRSQDDPIIESARLMHEQQASQQQLGNQLSSPLQDSAARRSGQSVGAGPVRQPVALPLLTQVDPAPLQPHSSRPSMQHAIFQEQPLQPSYNAPPDGRGFQGYDHSRDVRAALSPQRLRYQDPQGYDLARHPDEGGEDRWVRPGGPNDLDRWQHALQPDGHPAYSQTLPSQVPSGGHWIQHSGQPSSQGPSRQASRAIAPNMQADQPLSPAPSNDQAADRDRESVPALVQRAREVINRRMEKMQASPNWPATQLARPPHAYSHSSPGTSINLEEADQMRPAASHAVRGPATPDVREEQFYRDFRPGPGYQSPGHWQRMQGQYPSGAADDRGGYYPSGLGPGGYQPPGDTYGHPGAQYGQWPPPWMQSHEQAYYKSVGMPQPAAPAHPHQAYQYDPRGQPEPMANGSWVRGQQAPRSRGTFRTPPRERTPTRLPHQSSEPLSARMAGQSHAAANPLLQANRSLTVQQARDILGSFPRSPSHSSVAGRQDSPSLRDFVRAHPQDPAPASPLRASSVRSVNLSPFTRANQLRERDPSPLDKYPGNWHSPAQMRAQPAGAQLYPSSGRFRDDGLYREPMQQFPELHSDETRAEQANHAARVLHQASLNLGRTGSNAGSDVSHPSRGAPMSPRANLLPRDTALAEVAYENQMASYPGESAFAARTLEPRQETLPDSFFEDRQPITSRKIPRVVGGKVVPGLAGIAHGPNQTPANRASRREKKWNPSAPVIHENFVKNDPLPRPTRSSLAEAHSARNPLAGPTSVSVPTAGLQARGSARPSVPVRAVDDIGLTQKATPKYSSSVMNSSPEVAFLKQRQKVARQAPPPQLNGFRQQPEEIPALPEGPSPLVSQLSEGATPKSGLSPQPSIPESSISPSMMMGSEAPSGYGMGGDRMLPKQTSTAEEVMRDYLVGEGIKKAHFRALHPKAPKKKKTGFFASLFDRSSKA